MPLARAGWALLRGVVEPTRIAELGRYATGVYADIDAEVERDGPWAVASRRGFVPTVSSLRLEPAPLDLLVPAIRDAIEPVVGRAPMCNLDQVWLRRQFAPDRAPPWHSPHGWHQEGALHAAFARDSELLRTVTVWTPLVPCGVEAPGLELVDRRITELLPFDRLLPPETWPRLTPELEPGDVLLIDGGTLHRTHVAGAMRRDRISVELRLYAAVPSRCAHERHAPIGTGDRGV